MNKYQRGFVIQACVIWLGLSNNGYLVPERLRTWTLDCIKSPQSWFLYQPLQHQGRWTCQHSEIKQAKTKAVLLSSIRVGYYQTALFTLGWAFPLQVICSRKSPAGVPNSSLFSWFQIQMTIKICHHNMLINFPLRVDKHAEVLELSLPGLLLGWLVSLGELLWLMGGFQLSGDDNSCLY